MRKLVVLSLMVLTACRPAPEPKPYAGFESAAAYREYLNGGRSECHVWTHDPVNSVVTDTLTGKSSETKKVFASAYESPATSPGARERLERSKKESRCVNGRNIYRYMKEWKKYFPND